MRKRYREKPEVREYHQRKSREYGQKPEFIAWRQEYRRERMKDPAVKARANASTKRSNRKRAYGIQDPEIEPKLQELQGGRCAICGTEEPGGNAKSLILDHDHNTGLSRGLLCNKCNQGMGCLGDSPTRLQAALNYLNAPPAARVR